MSKPEWEQGPAVDPAGRGVRLLQTTAAASQIAGDLGIGCQRASGRCHRIASGGSGPHVGGSEGDTRLRHLIWPDCASFMAALSNSDCDGRT